MKTVTKSQKIIDAALVMFRRTHDIKKVSLEDIAAEAHVSPTTIYNYFGTRETLLFEVIKILVRENLETNRALIHSDIPFPQKIMGVINTKRDMISQVNSEIIEKIVSQDKNMGPFIEEIYQNEIKPLWIEMLADGKKQGYIDESLDEEALIIFLDVIKTGFSEKRELMQSISSRTDLLMQLTRIMFYGFLKKDIGLFRKEEK